EKFVLAANARQWTRIKKEKESKSHRLSPIAQRPAPLYKTGDLARWLVDGNIEFLGRIDNQVKIRGFRIECSEIEHHLSKHPGIREAAVMPQPQNPHKNKYETELFAYIVLKDSLNVDVTQLRTFLSGFLTTYMIPSYFVQLEKFPLTSSGKIDRKALTRAKGKTLELAPGARYSAPRNKIEEKLTGIWKDILGLEKIG
ncbi:MAG: amino acid adenylation domain-containing protein, partial [bacterium]|nr:amino acid adenylation domain-containing protein [bacterium]